MSHPPKWSRPVPRMIGKNRDIEVGLLYRSKCGRFEIRKDMMNNGGCNGYYTQASYKVTDATTDERRDCGTLTDAKEWAAEWATE